MTRCKRVAFAVACAVLLITRASAQDTGGLVIRGFVDLGYPVPSGEPGAGIAVWLAPVPADGVWHACRNPVDKAMTDAAGRFRLVAPAALRRAWRLCSTLTVSASADGAPDRALLFPLYEYRGRGRDSVQVYCRGHGPAGSPECRWVPWERALSWPGGEGYDGVARPPTSSAAHGTKLRRTSA